MEQWIEEFLYRGRPPSGPDSDKAPTFHVVIGQQADSPFGGADKQRRTVGPMSLEAAEQAGWAFGDIVAEMNADAIKQCAVLEAEIAAKDRLLEEGAAALAGASEDLKVASARVVALEVENSQMRALLAEAASSPAQG